MPCDAAGTPLLEAFVRGLHAYWRHPYRRRMAEPPVVWQRGAARLLDYGPPDGLPALIVPSLINRAHILDLMPERSLVRYLSRCGIRPLLLDWGEPGPAELRLTLAGYVEGHLCDALEHVRAAHAPRPALIGYCMGGVLALAGLRAEAIAGIGLLATPWDFHRGGPAPAAFDGLVARPAAALAGSLGGLPVGLIQTMFAGLEDWLNDGVPLAAALPRAEVRRAAGGHIGMVVGRRAERDLWRPLAAWLHSLAAMQESPW